MIRDSTSHLRILGGVPTFIPNRTDQVDTGSKHWYISYNNRDRKDYGSDTTALVLGQMEYFLILNGDHREAFRKAIEPDQTGLTSALQRCLDYIRANKDKLNSMGNELI